MDRPHAAQSAIEAEGLSVRIDPDFLAASMRYFDLHGSFASALRDAAGGPLPAPLRCVGPDPATGPGLTMIWRSPTEILLLTKDCAAFARLEQELAPQDDGCMVDQTGGYCVIRVRGPRTHDLLVRLGADTVIPELGEARTGRLAELQATAVRIQADEVLLIIERVYAEHMLEWIGVTAADF